jgi:hypothetical protein
MGLSCSPRNNYVLKGAKLKLPQGATMFLGEKELLLEDMIVLQEFNLFPKAT